MRPIKCDIVSQASPSERKVPLFSSAKLSLPFTTWFKPSVGVSGSTEWAPRLLGASWYGTHAC
eukprot:scaffold288651_cov31-Prasinocladus_malaysianus.AAC.2